MNSDDAILSVTDLTVSFTTPQGKNKAVDGIDFKVFRNQTLGLVGESGCGKTATAWAIMRLFSPDRAQITAKQISFLEKSLLTLPEHEMRKIRGKELAMCFQDSMSSLNPAFSCGNQLMEVLSEHARELNDQEKWVRCIEMLQRVGITDSEQRMRNYPHQLSGGLRQRIMIAMSLLCDPKLFIADEPTTALDVTIQAQILDLIKTLQQRMGMSVLFISHNLGVIAETCHDVAVMYAGQIVEMGPVGEVFSEPFHPYTYALLKSQPHQPHQSHQPHQTGPAQAKSRTKLFTIAGSVPDFLNIPLGCRFQDRCSRVLPACRKQNPPLVEYLNHGQGSTIRKLACFNPVSYPLKPVSSLSRSLRYRS